MKGLGVIFLLFICVINGEVLTPDNRLTIEQNLGETIYFDVLNLQPNSFYEIRISYPAIVSTNKTTALFQ